MVNPRLVAEAGSSNGQKRKASPNEEKKPSAKEAKIDENKSIKITVEVTKRFVFEVKENDSIASIMGKIPEEERISAGNLKAERLFHGDKKLLNNLTLSDYKIQGDTTLALKQIMIISVVDTDFEETTLQVADSDTVQNVLDKVTKDRDSLEGLLYNEQRLDPNGPLWQYRVRDGDFLQICRKEDGLETESEQVAPVDKSNGQKRGRKNAASKNRTLANNTMTIYVKLPNEKRIDLTVKFSDTIKDVMAKIRDRKEMPPGNQGLYYNETKLEIGKTLSDCHILPDSTLTMKEEMEIKVLCPDGVLINLKVKPSTTIRNIKAKVPSFHPERPYKVLFDGRRCYDYQTMADLDVEYGNVIEIYPENIKLEERW